MIKWITRWLLFFQFALAAGIYYALSSGGFFSKPAAVLFSIGVILLFRAFITANNFLIAATYGAAISSTPLNWRQWLRLFAGEFWATMLSSSWTLPFRCFQARIAKQPVGLPVLLVHGYGCNSGYWNSFSKQLLMHGVSHRALDLEPVFGSIDDYAALIDQAICKLRAETGQDRVIVVAHSMGGLAARAYLRVFGDGAIAKIITLGTPHGGTGLANFGLGLNTRQMRWQGRAGTGSQSSWLSDLHAQETASARRLFVSIYSSHDNIISPRNSAYLEGALNIEMPVIGHVALATNADVQRRVLQEIARASQTPAAA